MKQKIELLTFKKFSINVEEEKAVEFIDELYREPYVAGDVLADLKALQRNVNGMARELKREMEKGFKGSGLNLGREK